MAEQAALVTGAGSGLGLHIARNLAASGFAVAMNDVDEERASAAAQQVINAEGTAIAVPGDVSDEDAVEAMVTAVTDQLGPITVLVNNAGVADAVVPTAEQDPAAWQRVIDVDLRGVYLCSRRVGQDMLTHDAGGRIVNIASIAGLGGFPRRTAYGPAKAGVINLTQALAVEWAPSRITVNAVAPGYIRTAMLDELIASGRLDAAALNERIPMGELGAPADIAHAVSYLVSPAAGYITGATLVVDGGWTARGH